MEISLSRLLEFAGEIRNAESSSILHANSPGRSEIPEKKITNAIKSYGTDMGNDETLIILLDDTAFGSGKSGFFMTDKALYHRLNSSVFAKGPWRIPLTQIQTIDVHFGMVTSKKLIVNNKSIGQFDQSVGDEILSLVRFFELITGIPSETNRKKMTRYLARTAKVDAKNKAAENTKIAAGNSKIAAAEESKRLVIRRVRSRVEILTGIPNCDYDIIGPVFAVGTSGTDADAAAAAMRAMLGKVGYKTGTVQANPAVGFNAVLDQLDQQCRLLDGDGVVGVHFQLRMALSMGVGTVQTPEIWAFGTVIKYG
jgi:hypothetical protein